MSRAMVMNNKEVTMKKMMVAITLTLIILVMSCAQKEPFVLQDCYGFLEQNSRRAQWFDGEVGAVFSVDLELISGNGFDLLLMDEANFAKYEAGETFADYLTGSGLNMQSTLLEVELPETGQYIFVVDNTDKNEGGAVPQGSVIYHIVVALDQ